MGIRPTDGWRRSSQRDDDGNTCGKLRRITALGHFPILYTDTNGRVAHECILDLRPITKATGVSVDDVAKRLMDHGIHAPTMSFPVAGTLMVEPTESESLEEIDRFCDAMISIRGEIDRVADGEWPVDESPLRYAPHTAEDLLGPWERPYSRSSAPILSQGFASRSILPPSHELMERQVTEI